jgi:hypothetical protein
MTLENPFFSHFYVRCILLASLLHPQECDMAMQKLTYIRILIEGMDPVPTYLIPITGNCM